MRSERVDSQEIWFVDGVMVVYTSISKVAATGRGIEGNNELTSAVNKCRSVKFKRGRNNSKKCWVDLMVCGWSAMCGEINLANALSALIVGALHAERALAKFISPHIADHPHAIKSTQHFLELFRPLLNFTDLHLYTAD